MTLEMERVERAIIEKGSVVLEFDTPVGEDMVIWGRAVDSRTAIYLSEETDFVSTKAAAERAKKIARNLERNNPKVAFELCKGISIYAPRGKDSIMALMDVVMKALNMARKGEIHDGHNRIELADFMPMANVGWNAYWALTDTEISQVNTTGLKR